MNADASNRRTLARLAAGLTLTAIVSVLGGCPRPTINTTGLATAPVSPKPEDQHQATRLGQGDTIEVRVFSEPDLSGVYRVSPDGSIDFPLCGRMDVSNQLTSEVQSRLVQCLSNGYLKNPQVTVSGRKIGGLKRVTVFGNVQKPGTFPYEDNMSVVQAISVAGGFAQFAGQNSTNVIRISPDGKDLRYKVAVQDIGLGKAPNFFLQPGDIVFVPESAF